LKLKVSQTVPCGPSMQIDAPEVENQIVVDR
jgi:hypothetical protein